MTEFVNGTYQITDGEIISDFESQECVISSELATLNEITVGQTITLKNPNTEATYEFVVKGIYKDNSDSNDSSSMYSKSANKIITGSKVIENLVVDDSTLVTTITPTFILKDKDSIEKFTTEIKEKGLSEYYTLNTNVEELESATKSIENVKTFATTFLLIMLAISAVVLFVINMINIRERKYEIGVFRTIGVSKFKLTLQFALEILIVSVVMLGIGAVCGSFLAKPVGNMLLENEIQSVQEEKGTDVLVNACKELPDIKFVFAGKGPLESMVNGVSNIENVGFQSGFELEKLIREAKFSICPSSCYENCPFSVMESQMFGTPVLGANIGGIPELIKVGETGELFKSGDKNDLVHKIKLMYNSDIDKYVSYCRNTKFKSIDEYCNVLLNVYKF